MPVRDDYTIICYNGQGTVMPVYCIIALLQLNGASQGTTGQRTVAGKQKII